jgi:hypothetical protein
VSVRCCCCCCCWYCWAVHFQEIQSLYLFCISLRSRGFIFGISTHTHTRNGSITSLHIGHDVLSARIEDFINALVWIDLMQQGEKKIQICDLQMISSCVYRVYRLASSVSFFLLFSPFLLRTLFDSYREWLLFFSNNLEWLLNCFFLIFTYVQQ